jgi:hypothetical protein
VSYNPITEEDARAFCEAADAVTARMCRSKETARAALVQAGIIIEEDCEEMDIVVTDKIGNVLEVGDKVVYGRSSGDDVHFGTVSEVFENNTIKVKNDKTNRNSVNHRAGVEVLNVSHLTDMFPEYFI